MRFIRLIKKWLNMFSGESIFHVEQSIGKCYSKNKIKGYYNDLTNKVSEQTILDNNGIPINTTIAGIKAYFPITIFQYGLGLYDLYLIEKKDDYREKFMNIVNWAVSNQLENGMWDCMGKLNNQVHKTQSSMCQGEGASLLLRAYTLTNDNKYYSCATKAIDFMLKSINEGGTTLYIDNDIIFQEYVSEYNLSVLNGWIFSIFGLYDYTLVNKDKKYSEILKKTLETLKKYLIKYDRKYWTNYDTKKTIASPFYHNLHINQLSVLYKLFDIEEFNYYSKKWEKYQNSKIKKIFSMFIKLKQKLLKNKYYDINTSLLN